MLPIIIVRKMIGENYKGTANVGKLIHHGLLIMRDHQAETTKEIYNIGLGEEISILDLAKKLILMIKNTENFEDNIRYINDRDFNDKRYYISYEKIRLLGWERKINLDDGLKQTIEYYIKK